MPESFTFITLYRRFTLIIDSCVDDDNENKFDNNEKMISIVIITIIVRDINS